jgi:riboflavin synthase alpha subunit
MADSKEFLRISNLQSWYGESHILHGVDMTVNEGEVVTLLGRNGAGRTTTVKSILGLVGRRTGSITINGVSLTVNQVQDFFDADGPLGLRGSEISINIIPHTVDHTALGSLKTGHTVNLEIDTVARYVERMLRVDASLGTAATLKAHP